VSNRFKGVVLAATFGWLSGCHAAHPSRQQIDSVNQLIQDRTTLSWDVGKLTNHASASAPEPVDELTLREATERALARNLSLVASTENLSIAHAQLVAAGLIANPTLGQSSGLLFPFSSHMYPSVDGNITQVLNSIFTQPARVSIGKLEELQANIDMASQAYLLAQQVDSKYQEMVGLRRRRRLAERIADLYARAVQAAEARRKVGILTTPELNRAKLSYQDARRQVAHLTTQYARAAREMNWLMGYSTEPKWHLPQSVVDDSPPISTLPESMELQKAATQFRLDLIRADLDRKLGEKGIALAKLGLIPQITVGAEVARDSQHNVVGGPMLIGVTLPIFDPGLVSLDLAYAQQRKAEKTYAALNGQVGQDVRTALDNWRIAADDVTFYRESLIPQQEQNVRLMETSFRLGNDDLDTLLNVYQNYVSQLQAFEDALQAYHDSTVALQQVVGLTWDKIARPPAQTQPTTQSATLQPAESRPAATQVMPLPGPLTSRQATTQPQTTDGRP